MGKHGETGHISGSIDTGDIRTHAVIDLDSAGTACRVESKFHSDVFKAEILDVGPAAHAHQDLVPADTADLSFRIFVDNRIALDSGDFATQAELHSPLLVLLLEHFADLVIERSEDLREHLHYSNLRTEGAEECCELHSDHSSADHHQFFRALIQGQYLAVCHDHVTGFLQARERRDSRLRAGADQQVLCSIDVSRCFNFDPFRITALDGRILGNHLDLSSLHGRLDTADEFLDHLVLAGHDLIVFESRIAYIDSVMVACLGIVVDLGTVKKGFGRDTALIQADSAERLPFEKDDLEAGRSGPFCGHITTGTAADNR